MVQHTPVGNWPYVQGSDTVSAYPTTSQELATSLETRTTKLPFAMAAGDAAVVITNAAFGTLAVTFPAGRFAVSPLPVATPASTAGYAAMTMSASTAGMTIRLDHIQAVSQSATVPTRWIAVQMLAGAAPGVTLAADAVEFVVTCHTDGCSNADIPITLEYAEADGPPDGVQCGVCGQTITDHSL